MDERILEQKLGALAGYGVIGEERARRLGAALRKQDDWGLFRINPLWFAEQHRFEPREAVDLCVHGARVGLFDFAFHQLCPYCAGIAFTQTELSSVTREFHCNTCEVDHVSTLDDLLEVAFTISPAVHPLSVRPFADPESYFRTFYSPNCDRPPEVSAFFRSQMRAFVSVPPDSTQAIELETQVGEQYAILSADTHSKLSLKVVAGGPNRVAVGYHAHGPDVPSIELGSGRVSIVLSNSSAVPIGGFLGTEMTAMLRELGTRHPPTWRPYLTGKMLLNNQSFRELFRVQTLAPDLKLSLKSLTLLFTDLKGSTELYDRTGDVYAYQVVQEHFRALAEAVRRHDGAIVKTMGDAVMASFSTSRDAVAAAVEMMRAMESINSRVRADGHETGLKVGVHEGAALAVNAESRLDYFGQTVNIAARVQALAGSGEIWLTESVGAADGVSATLERAGYRGERQVVALKGVGTPTPVFRWVT